MKLFLINSQNTMWRLSVQFYRGTIFHHCISLTLTELLQLKYSSVNQKSRVHFEISLSAVVLCRLSRTIRLWKYPLDEDFSANCIHSVCYYYIYFSNKHTTIWENLCARWFFTTTEDPLESNPTFYMDYIHH